MVEFSAFQVVFTGPITARYNDRTKENAHEEGHWAYRKNTLSGKPEPCFIDTFEAQREFVKSEGLANPKEFGNNFEVGDDGKTVKNSCGMPGCEI
jgi:hypothetical protein